MLKKYKYVNTRQYMRLESPHMIRYKLLEDDSTISAHKGLTGAGISFISAGKLPLSGTIDLEIDSPTISHSIRAIAKVIKVEPTRSLGTYKISAQLIKIDDRDKEALGKITHVDIYDSSQFIELSPQYFAIKHKELAGVADTSVTEDISAGGIAFISNKEISVSALIELEINFPATPYPIKATARVVRTEPAKRGSSYRIAAQFIKIADKDRKTIDSFIKEMAGNRRQRKWWWRKLK